MFGKKKEAKVETKKEAVAVAEPARKGTPKDAIVKAVEQLEPGKSVAFVLPKDYGDWQLVVELNPKYPGKGKKYEAGREDIVNGVPAGSKFHQFDTNQPMEIAEWVLDRKATLRQA